MEALFSFYAIVLLIMLTFSDGNRFFRSNEGCWRCRFGVVCLLCYCKSPNPVNSVIFIKCSTLMWHLGTPWQSMASFIRVLFRNRLIFIQPKERKRNIHHSNLFLTLQLYLIWKKSHEYRSFNNQICKIFLWWLISCLKISSFLDFLFPACQKKINNFASLNIDKYFFLPFRYVCSHFCVNKIYFCGIQKESSTSSVKWLLKPAQVLVISKCHDKKIFHFPFHHNLWGIPFQIEKFSKYFPPYQFYLLFSA